MIKYTVGVNAYDYLTGLYDTKKEAEDYAFGRIKKEGLVTEENWKNDDYYKDKPFRLYALDMAHEMSWYNVEKIYGVD